MLGGKKMIGKKGGSEKKFERNYLCLNLLVLV